MTCLAHLAISGMEINQDTCDHDIGTATVEYQSEVIKVGDSASCLNFFGYRFCPHCGDDVTALAKEFEGRVYDHWKDFWQWYGNQHGEQELRRAMKSEFALYFPDGFTVGVNA